MATLEELLQRVDANIAGTTQQPREQETDDPAIQQLLERIDQKSAIDQQLEALDVPPETPTTAPRREELSLGQQILRTPQARGLAEFGAGAAEATFAIPDIITRGISAIGGLVDEDFSIPSLGETELGQRLQTGPLEEGTTKDVIRAAGGAALGGGAIQQGIRETAKRLPGVASDIAAKVLPQQLTTRGTGAGIAETLAAQSIPSATVLGGVSGAGAQLGEEAAGTPGALLGALAAPLGAQTLARPITKALLNARSIIRTQPSPENQEILKAAEREGVDVFTTDLAQPTSFLGNLTQRFSSKLGLLGTGARRADQQLARQESVKQLAQRFDIELDSPFLNEIVESLTKESAKRFDKLGTLRKEAVDVLNTGGKVPMPRTRKMIQQVLAEQRALGAKVNTDVVDKMNDNLSSISSRNFENVGNIRTEVIRDLNTAEQAGNAALTGASKRVKNAMDQDLKSFGGRVDKEAIGKWNLSNKGFRDEIELTRRTELRRVLQGGEATPEKVEPLFKGGKRSELVRLHGSLNEEGRASGRAFIVRDLLDKAGFFKGELNPDRIATEFGKTAKQQQIDVFFKGRDLEQLQGLNKLLNATRRGQQAPQVLETGQQIVPLLGLGGAGAAGLEQPLITFGIVGSLSAAAKAYESKAFRDMLIRINRAKSGSDREKELIGNAVPIIQSALQGFSQRSQRTPEEEAALMEQIANQTQQQQ